MYAYYSNHQISNQALTLSLHVARMKILVMKTVSVLLIPLAILRPTLGGELRVRLMSLSLIQSNCVLGISCDHYPAVSLKVLCSVRRSVCCIYIWQVSLMTYMYH